MDQGFDFQILPWTPRSRRYQKQIWREDCVLFCFHAIIFPLPHIPCGIWFLCLGSVGQLLSDLCCCQCSLGYILRRILEEARNRSCCSVGCTRCFEDSKSTTRFQTWTHCKRSNHRRRCQSILTAEEIVEAITSNSIRYCSSFGTWKFDCNVFWNWDLHFRGLWWSIQVILGEWFYFQQFSVLSGQYLTVTDLFANYHPDHCHAYTFCTSDWICRKVDWFGELWDCWWWEQIHHICYLF